MVWILSHVVLPFLSLSLLKVWGNMQSIKFAPLVCFKHTAGQFSHSRCWTNIIISVSPQLFLIFPNWSCLSNTSSPYSTFSGPEIPYNNLYIYRFSQFCIPQNRNDMIFALLCVWFIPSSITSSKYHDSEPISWKAAWSSIICMCYSTWVISTFDNCE